MKCFDALTKIFKKLQEKNLSVYIENVEKKYNIVCNDQHVILHSFDTRQKAIDFCRHLNINIIGYIKYKI